MMANRIMTRAEVDGAAIWYFEESGQWWMEPTDKAKKREVLASHVDAIHVTNAYDVLDPLFVRKLIIESGR